MPRSSPRTLTAEARARLERGRRVRAVLRQPQYELQPVALQITILLALAARNLLKTKVGRALIAIRDAEIAAETLGVNIMGYKTLAFAISAFYAGIGGHRLETVSGSVAHGLKPDFWMKTLHRSDYWSFRHPERKSNKYCDDADAVIAYMETLKEPWIAFKTLAAGAIRPQDAFRWCFESGADFICVGMYDFQLVEDANLAHDVLSGKVLRKRPWRA